MLTHVDDAMDSSSVLNSTSGISNTEIKNTTIQSNYNKLDEKESLSSIDRMITTTTVNVNTSCTAHDEVDSSLKDIVQSEVPMITETCVNDDNASKSGEATVVDDSKVVAVETSDTHPNKDCPDVHNDELAPFTTPNHQEEMGETDIESKEEEKREEVMVLPNDPTSDTSSNCGPSDSESGIGANDVTISTEMIPSISETIEKSNLNQEANDSESRVVDEVGTASPNELLANSSPQLDNEGTDDTIHESNNSSSALAEEKSDEVGSNGEHIVAVGVQLVSEEVVKEPAVEIESQVIEGHGVDNKEDPTEESNFATGVNNEENVDIPDVPNGELVNDEVPEEGPSLDTHSEEEPLIDSSSPSADVAKEDSSQELNQNESTTNAEEDPDSISATQERNSSEVSGLDNDPVSTDCVEGPSIDTGCDDEPIDSSKTSTSIAKEDDSQEINQTVSTTNTEEGLDRISATLERNAAEVSGSDNDHVPGEEGPSSGCEDEPIDLSSTDIAKEDNSQEINQTVTPTNPDEINCSELSECPAEITESQCVIETSTPCVDTDEKLEVPDRFNEEFDNDNIDEKVELGPDIDKELCGELAVGSSSTVANMTTEDNCIEITQKESTIISDEGADTTCESQEVDLTNNQCDIETPFQEIMEKSVGDSELERQAEEGHPIVEGKEGCVKSTDEQASKDTITQLDECVTDLNPVSPEENKSDTPETKENTAETSESYGNRVDNEKSSLEEGNVFNESELSTPSEKQSEMDDASGDANMCYDIVPYDNPTPTTNSPLDFIPCDTHTPSCNSVPNAPLQTDIVLYDAPAQSTTWNLEKESENVDINNEEFSDIHALLAGEQQPVDGIAGPKNEQCNYNQAKGSQHVDGTIGKSSTITRSQNEVAVSVPIFSRIPENQLIQGCIHSIFGVMRAEQKRLNPSRLIDETLSGEISRHPLYVQLQELLQKTSAVNTGHPIYMEGQNPSDTLVDSSEEDEEGDDEDDESGDSDREGEDDGDSDEESDSYDDEEANKSKSFLQPFCEGVRRRDVSASVTCALLAALQKFMLYDILIPDIQRHSNGMTKADIIRMITESITRCSFEDASDGIQRKQSSEQIIIRDDPVCVSNSQHSATSSGPSFAISNLEAEMCALKLMEVVTTTVDYSIRNGMILLPDEVTSLLATCLHICHGNSSVSLLLQSAASSAASQIVLTIFHERMSVVGSVSDDTCKQEDSHRLSVLKKLHDLIQKSNTPAPTSTVLVHVLNILNTALDSSRDRIPCLTERKFWQTDIFKSVLSIAMDARDCSVLEAAVRLFFNLWVSMRYELKGEFEVFLQSVHFRILDGANKEISTTGRRRKIAASPASVIGTAEAREIILENLLDICRLESNILREIFFNYDCDGACSNLYENLIVALCKTTSPENWLDKAAANKADIALTASSNMASTPTTVSEQSLEIVVGRSQSNQYALPSESSVVTNELAVPASNSSQPQRTVGYDKQSIGKRAPLSQANRLAMEGVLSSLYSISYPSLYKENESQHSNQDSVKSCIIEVGKSGDAVVVPEETLHSRKRRKISLQKIARCFSDSTGYDEWMSLAIAEGLMPDDFSSSSLGAAKAAELLYCSQDIDKTKLGTYLSRGPDNKYPFEVAVRKEFAALHNFEGMSFPVALRSFLSKFRLPGEAQCIDRIMEVFSREYYKQQGEFSFFKNSDAVYVLAFSTIMLNTDLHNRTIKSGERMTKEQFVRNNRGINAGSDLDEAFLRDLYDQIKERELQVRREVGELKQSSEQHAFSTTWEGLQSKKREMERPLHTCYEEGQQTCSQPNDMEMFQILAFSSIKALEGAFLRSKDDDTVVRSLRALQHLVKMAESFQLDAVIKEIVQVLLAQGREYITLCLAFDYSSQDDGGPVVGSNVRTLSVSDSIEDEAVGIDTDQPIPYGLLCVSASEKTAGIAGSAAHRGLLALDSGFVLFKKYSPRISEAWPAFIECICALRYARALPESLSELDDFADSSGKVLPLSSYAVSSKKALDEYYRSLSDKDANKNKGWLRSFFRGSKGSGPDDSGEGTENLNVGELSAGAKALLRVAEAADVEDVLQLGSMKLPDSTIQSLLASVAEYPFVSDPIGENQSVYSLELAARALLSDREHAVTMFTHFLTTFEGILCRISSDKVLSPFVIERIVVAILRFSIHLYEIPELRPNLRSSLQLITMTLPKSFIRVIADRLACGMAIILRASFHFFETANEWTFMGDTLDMLANFSISRELVFDGIASTLEYAIPSIRDADQAEDDRPKISLDACESLSRILIRFTLGFYKGDLSLTIPAMLCLEKVYRFKADMLLKSLSNDEQPIDATCGVPDKEFWQNVAVAVYSVCRSPDPESSKHGLDCFRRVILRTRADHIPDDKWIAVLYLMVNKQPPLAAEASRGNTYALLGHLLTSVLPSISKNKEVKDDLVDLINQVAALTNENLLQCRHGSASPLFEKTLQTATYLSNHMMSDEWGGDSAFSSWASETILTELERAGASVLYEKTNGVNPLNDPDPAIDKLEGDESEVSELSATENNDEDNVRT